MKSTFNIARYHFYPTRLICTCSLMICSFYFSGCEKEIGKSENELAENNVSLPMMYASSAWQLATTFQGNIETFIPRDDQLSSFVIEGNGKSYTYILTPNDPQIANIDSVPLWRYDGKNSWKKMRSLRIPGWNGIAILSAATFSIGNKGYVVGGRWDNSFPIFLNSCWEYDADKDTWTQKKDFPGLVREHAVGFSINGIGYVGTGHHYFFTSGPNNSQKSLNDFWRYNPANDSWKRIDSIPQASPRYSAIAFVLKQKAYVGGGFDILSGQFLKDFYEYDATTGRWTKLPDLPGDARYGAVAFTIGNTAYFGTGTSQVGLLQDFWSFDRRYNYWKQLEDFPDGPHNLSVGFSLNGYGFVGLGTNYAPHPDEDYSFNKIYRYDPTIITIPD